MPTILENVSLQTLNTLGVSATARYFFRVENDEDLIQALAFARVQGCKVLVLGGGSNVVLETDFPGLVIHMQTRGIRLIETDCERVTVSVEAGENWHGLVQYCLEQGWYGLENLALIPGTVGAAPVQNIGAYGVELAEVLVALDAIHIDSGERQHFTKDACQFGYRDSFFKGSGLGQYVITRIQLQLQLKPQLNVAYPALQQAIRDQLDLDEDAFTLALLAGRVSPQHVFNAVCSVRRSKLPDPQQIPNAGSFFKNPVVDIAKAEVLLRAFPALVTYPAAQGVKLAAGWLVEQAGWKGFNANGAVAGRAGVHDLQSLVLVNPNHVTGSAVLALAKEIQQAVFTKFGVQLEIEPYVVSAA